LSPDLLLVLAAILVTFGYIVACRIWPYAACRACDGAGRRRSPSGRAWRTCRRCRGTGARLRLGRKAWKHWRDLSRKSA
jgi:DnaJ-class molecular chaperone